MFGNFVEVIATVTTTLIVQKSLCCVITQYHKKNVEMKGKEIEMIHRLFVVIAMYCQASSPAVQ